MALEHRQRARWRLLLFDFSDPDVSPAPAPRYPVAPDIRDVFRVHPLRWHHSLNMVSRNLEYEISARQKAEAALADVNRKLEQLIAQRTAALEEKNLQLQKEIKVRSAAEDALRANEQRLQSLVTAVSELFWVASPQGDLLDARPSFTEYTGMPIDPKLSLIGNWHSAIHPDDLPRLVAEMEAGFSKPVIMHHEYRMRRADGNWAHLMARMVPIFNEQGDIREWVGVSIDITEKRRSQEQLNSLNRQLEQLIAAIQDLSSAREVGAIGGVVTQAVRGLTNADDAELLIKGVDSAIGGAGALASMAMRNKTMSVIEDTALDTRAETEPYRKSGIHSLLIMPLCNGQSLGAIACYWRQPHAVSSNEVKLLETLANAVSIALTNVKLYEELEQRVSERTAQLQAVNKELETFTYSVSHDLRAPLRSIDGFSRLLLDEHGADLSEEGRKFVGHIREGTRQMNQLIHDLLEYSRAERRTIRSAETNVRAVVQALLAQSASDIASRSASVRMEVPDEVIVTDETGLRMALRNLLDNALKFSSSVPKPEIVIGGKREPTRLILWVSDNGIGIDPKFHDRIFEIFQRLHRQEAYPGTGVGLAIVRVAMQRMGGSVRVESSPGQGTAFFLEIPL